MIAIADVNEQWGIGKDGDLLVYIPEDMKFFRRTTKGAVVIMGRRTLESFPGKAPLKGRKNLVITHIGIGPETQDAYAKMKAAEDGTELLAFTDVDKLLEYCAQYPGDSVFVIGGESVYRLMLPYCDKCLITKNDYQGESDTYFPNLDEDPEWTETEHGPENVTEDGIRYRFTVYERIRTD